MTGSMPPVGGASGPFDERSSSDLAGSAPPLVPFILDSDADPLEGFNPEHPDPRADRAADPLDGFKPEPRTTRRTVRSTASTVASPPAGRARRKPVDDEPAEPAGLRLRADEGIDLTAAADAFDRSLASRHHPDLPRENSNTPRFRRALLAAALLVAALLVVIGTVAVRSQRELTGFGGSISHAADAVPGVVAADVPVAGPGNGNGPAAATTTPTPTPTPTPTSTPTLPPPSESPAAARSSRLVKTPLAATIVAARRVGHQAPDLLADAGWFAVASPLSLRIVENGRTVGESSGTPAALTSGAHQLELVNEETEFRVPVSIQIEAGKTTRISIPRPTGTLSLSASPWAEVLLDGRSLGRTPIANAQVPVGRHDIAWRHPGFGEMRSSVVVGAHTPARASMEFSP